MAEFLLAIPVVLQNEGGLVDDPADPGGLTKYGISQRRYPDLDIRNLSVADATAIYLRDFWLFSGIAAQAVGTKLFDSYVNMEHDAIKIAQRIVGGITVDGSYGPNTEEAINDMDPTAFLVSFRASLVQHYQAIAAAKPAESKFLTDWLRRARQ